MERDDWLAWRRSGVGASDVAAILGISPWSSPWSVWADKVGLSAGPDDSESMEFGRLAEPILAAYFTDRTGLHVVGEQTWCTHPDESWMLCTVDGFVVESPASAAGDALGLFEAKTTSEAPWDEVPVHYMAQAGWQMAVTGLGRVWFGVLHLSFGRPRFRVYEVVRDAADEAVMVAGCRRFWFEHVVAGTPPVTDGHPATGPAIGAVFPVDDGSRVVADADLVATVEHLRLLRADAKQLEAAIVEAENAVKAAMGEAVELVADGGDGVLRPLVTWKAQARASVDLAGLREAAPEVVAAHTITLTSRVLRVKKARN